MFSSSYNSPYSYSSIYFCAAYYKIKVQNLAGEKLWFDPKLNKTEHTCKNCFVKVNVLV